MVFCCEIQPIFDVGWIKLVFGLWVWVSYRERKSPTAVFHRTRRHSGSCKRSGKCSLVTSTSQEGSSEKFICLKKKKSNFGLWRQMMLTDVSFGDVVLVLRQISGQAKVTDLGQLPLTDQHVPRSQIPVETLEDKLMWTLSTLTVQLQNKRRRKQTDKCSPISNPTFLEERKSMAWATWKEKLRRSWGVRRGESLRRSIVPCWSEREQQDRRLQQTDGRMDGRMDVLSSPAGAYGVS